MFSIKTHPQRNGGQISKYSELMTLCRRVFLVRAITRAVIIAYKHIGMRDCYTENNKSISRQPDFLGTISANTILSSPNYKMIGMVYTNRYDENTRRYGSSGRLRLMRFKTKYTDPNDIYADAERNGIIELLEKEIMTK